MNRTFSQITLLKNLLIISTLLILSSCGENHYLAVEDKIISSATPPTALADGPFAGASFGAAISANVLFNDTPGNSPLVPSSISITSNSNPTTQGTCSIGPAPNFEISFTPVSNFTGPASCTYQICDSNSLCDSASVSFNPHDGAAPIANDDSASTPPNTPITINVASNDTDANSNLNQSSLSITSNANTLTEGSCSITNAPLSDITFTPVSGFIGSASCTYQICDSNSPTPQCDSASVSITVNTPPTALADGPFAGASFGAAISANVLFNDTPGNSPLVPSSISITSNSNPTTQGTCSIGPAPNFEISFTPVSNFTGPASCTYQICDSNSLCDSASVSFNPHDGAAPIANDDSASTPPNTPITINVASNDTDANSNLNQSSLSITSNANTLTEGSCSITNAPLSDITFTPVSGFIGSASCTYQICDSNSPTPQCDSASVSITVNTPSAPRISRVSPLLTPGSIALPQFQIKHPEHATGGTFLSGDILKLYADDGSCSGVDCCTGTELVSITLNTSRKKYSVKEQSALTNGQVKTYYASWNGSCSTLRPSGDEEKASYEYSGPTITAITKPACFATNTTIPVSMNIYPEDFSANEESDPNGFCETADFSAASNCDSADGVSGDDTFSSSCFHTGNGTYNFPYLICSMEQLQELNLDLTKHYELGKNLDASSANSWNGANGILPIAQAGSANTTTTYFRGSLDGNGFTISNLEVNRNETTTSFQGLFGKLAGVVKNLKIKDSTATLTSPGTSMGVLAGRSQCLITTGVTIENYNYPRPAGGLAIAGGNLVGGLIGDAANTTKIYNCHSSGSIDTYKDSVGGLIGLLGSTLSTDMYLHNSSSNSNIIMNNISPAVNSLNQGGLAGLIQNVTSIDNSEARGELRIIDNVNALPAALPGGFASEIVNSNISNSHTFVNVHQLDPGGSGAIAGGFSYRIRNSTITNSSSNGDVEFISPRGAAGFSAYITEGTLIDKCHSSSHVYTVPGITYQYTGAFAVFIGGVNTSGDPVRIRQSYFDGKFDLNGTLTTGSNSGFIGAIQNSATVENSYSIGEVNFSNMTTTLNNFGGFIGLIYLNANDVIVRNNYYAGTVVWNTSNPSENNVNNTGGFIGRIGSSVGSNYVIENNFSTTDFSPRNFTGLGVAEFVGKIDAAGVGYTSSNNYNWDSKGSMICSNDPAFACSEIASTSTFQGNSTNPPFLNGMIQLWDFTNIWNVVTGNYPELR